MTKREISRSPAANPLGLTKHQLEPPMLVIHRDSSFSVKVRRGRKWLWLRNSDDIQLRDFKRLSNAEQNRVRRWEYQNQRLVVVPDYEA